MSDKEKFEGFKKKMIDDNEKKYGKEIREKYGNDTVEKSNKKINEHDRGSNMMRLTKLGRAGN